MILKIYQFKKLFYLFFLLFFSAAINHYYAGRGAFPLDTFLHFDSGYRILNGEHPFTDFWMVSGLVVNYMQAIFFSVFGVNWHSYVIHASLMSGFLTVSTFLILKNFKLKNDFCFLYALLFSILAYPTSGTPFADYHSAFFSLIAIYCLLFAIDTNKKLYWSLIPIFLGLAFFSKQVPASYVILSILIILPLYSFKKKNIKCISYFLLGAVIFIFFAFVFGFINRIDLTSFLEQYIFYPLTIGSNRFENLVFSYRGVIDHFKFIYLAIIPFLYVNLRKIYKEKNYFTSNDFFIFISLLSLTISLIFNQLLTLNQTFIFFLIPILSGFSHISFINLNFKYKNIFNLLIILICLFATFKYHIRFNEERKFHELKGTNFNLSISASKIHNKLSGLSWITPEFKNQPQKEIDYINEIQLHLKGDARKKMVITNYLFLSGILDQKLYSPSFAYTHDGTTHPIKGSPYFKKYKDLMVNIIKKNNISVIYLAGSINENHLYDYIDKSCFEVFFIFQYLKSYELKSCGDI